LLSSCLSRVASATTRTSPRAPKALHRIGVAWLDHDRCAELAAPPQGSDDHQKAAGIVANDKNLAAGHASHLRHSESLRDRHNFTREPAVPDYWKTRENEAAALAAKPLAVPHSAHVRLETVAGWQLTA
jgi:hypothetical protein